MSDRMPRLSVLGLLQVLRPVTNWHALGLHLNVPAHQLDDIARRLSHEGSERCKAELFQLLLRKLPSVGWEEVITALEKTSQHKLAGELKEKLEIQAAIVFKCSSADDLQADFSSLVKTVKRLLKEGEVKVKSVQRCLKKSLNIRHSHTPQSIKELFDMIAPHFSPVNPYLLVCLIQKFCTMHGEVQHQLKLYNQCLEEFCYSTTMEQFAHFPLQSDSSSDVAKPWGKAAVVSLEVVGCWIPVSVHQFHFLLSKMFPKNDKMFNHMTVRCCRNSLRISWLVPESSVRLLRSLAREKVHMMELVGVLFLAIDGTMVMQENSNLTDFDLGLMEAVQAVDKEAISLLLKLGADPSRQDTQGNTALMVARKNESYDTVLQLLRESTQKGQTKTSSLLPPVNHQIYSSLSSSSENEEVGMERDGCNPTFAIESHPPLCSGSPDHAGSPIEKSPSIVTLQEYTGVIAQRPEDFAEDSLVRNSAISQMVAKGRLNCLLNNGMAAWGSVKTLLNHLSHHSFAAHWLASSYKWCLTCSSALLVNNALTIVMSMLIVMFLISTLFLFCKLSELDPALSPWRAWQPWCTVFDLWNYSMAT